MIVLKLLRLIYPSLHPVKYKWINYWYGKQDGKVWDKYTDI